MPLCHHGGVRPTAMPTGWPCGIPGTVLPTGADTACDGECERSRVGVASANPEQGGPGRAVCSPRPEENWRPRLPGAQLPPRPPRAQLPPRPPGAQLPPSTCPAVNTGSHSHGASGPRPPACRAQLPVSGAVGQWRIAPRPHITRETRWPSAPGDMLLLGPPWPVPTTPGAWRGLKVSED